MIDDVRVLERWEGFYITQYPTHCSPERTPKLILEDPFAPGTAGGMGWGLRGYTIASFSNSNKTTSVRGGTSGVMVATTTVRYQPRTDDLRISLFFLFCSVFFSVQAAFFWTGNVASIS